MLKKFIRLVGGDPDKREIDRYTTVVEQINALEAEFEQLSDEALRAKTGAFRAGLANQLRGMQEPKEILQAEGEFLEGILPEAFAAVREASKRTIGLRHYDVQLIGGIVLHRGKIAEMRTGEGKTLVATLPLYLNALTGKGAHLITVNDYLARRDARWMAPIYNLLGLSVGVLQMAARTENGKKAFLVDLEHESPHEDQNQLRMVARTEAYAADITYGTNSEFGFDYLRDNMTMLWEERVQRGHSYAIIDEVDNVLIDEARTPLIISGPAQDEAEWYVRMAQVVRQLRLEDYEVNEKDRTVSLTELGESHVEELLGMPMRDPERPEDVTLEQARMMGYLEQALRAQFLFKRNKDYLVQGGKVIIVDEFTGRMMPGRRWSDGLHQAVEAKEGARVQSESVTYATITIQNYFRMYGKLAGMSGTAVTEAEEFDKIYKLGVLAIPTNLEHQASQPNSDLVEVDSRDEHGYKYNYYTRKGDAEKAPIFWRRKDYPDVVYRTGETKLRAIAREILRDHAMGCPVLVGTSSVEMSELVSQRLKAEPLRRLCQAMLLRHVWMVQNDRIEDGRQISELQFLYESLDTLDISEMRKLGREMGISFNPEDAANLGLLLELLELPAESQTRLESDLKAGIPHEVLNARKHTEESQIIAGAGAFGSVTIATNMAGRGVDIKLGGELAEEILAAVNRVLKRNGVDNPYDLTLPERQQRLLALPPASYGIYEAEIQFFFQHMREMEQVRSLGGLHVIGSERHDARRIDNQLRGRAARQGDPGSSRFYLSMQDDLMRLFGGQQAEAMMDRLKVDDALPLEVGLVSRIVEQSQTRVEGANFDVRKHLLEYDDVLNSQRASIYAQRNRIFHKEDLTDDVREMLRTEVTRRIPEALADEGGPWKLLAWLEQVQPSISIGRLILPTFSLALMLRNMRWLAEKPGRETARRELLNIARQALEAEREHHLQSILAMLQQNEARLEEQIDERLEIVDAFIEGLSLEDQSEVRRPAEIVNELSGTVHLPLRLTTEAQRSLYRNPDLAAEEIRQQITNALTEQTIKRLVGAVERRLDESLGLSANQLSTADWSELADKVLGAVSGIFEQRIERYLGENGQITKDVDSALARLQPPYDRQKVLQILLIIPRGARATFDKRTHRRVFQQTNRLTYVFHAAGFMENIDSKDIAADVLEHLESVQNAVCESWGAVELQRLSSTRLAEFEESVREAIFEKVDKPLEPFLQQPVSNLPIEILRVVGNVLGRRALTGIYRQLLLGVITQLWVDYLTQMEALRVSIGLEAYAQRDPLVQYKSRASELFENLLGSMRLEVVSRMFTYRPRDLSQVQTAANQEEAEIEEMPETEADDAEEVEAGERPDIQIGESPRPGGGKRRRRHKK